jgi:hypothetical protein
MRKIVFVGVASVFFGLSVASQDAMAMGGQGGPSDAWGSPYVLIAPQTFKPPAGWGPLEGRSAYEAQAPVDCQGDRACERRMKRNTHPVYAPQ